MCFRPITIWNNSNQINGSFFNATFQVPCGRCEACQDLKAYQMKSRCFYESEECRLAGGVCVFQTLTYAPECLPLCCGVPCFNHADIVKFRKQLRQSIVNAGYKINAKDGFDTSHPPFRCLITSEFGGNYHRPHYHVLVWSYVPGLSALELNELICLSWRYGFTDKQPKIVELGDSMGAVKYITDYLSVLGKEVADLEKFRKMAFDRSSLISEYKFRYPEKSCNDSDLYQLYCDILHEHADSFKMRMWTSNGLGSYWLVKLANDPAFAEEFERTHELRIPNVKNGWTSVPLCHYYTYKLMYDRVYNDRTGRHDKFVLNEFGHAYRSGTLDKQIDALNETLQKSHAEASQNDKLRIKQLLKANTLRDLARYAICLRGKVCIGDQYRQMIFCDYDSSVFHVSIDEVTNDPNLAHDIGLHTELNNTDNPLKMLDVSQGFIKEHKDFWLDNLITNKSPELLRFEECLAILEHYSLIRSKLEENERLRIKDIKYELRKLHREKVVR